MIERIADARAENGAEQNRLNMTSELLVQNQTNLEAAHGRIMDADVALESTRFARQKSTCPILRGDGRPGKSIDQHCHSPSSDRKVLKLRT